MNDLRMRLDKLYANYTCHVELLYVTNTNAMEIASALLLLYAILYIAVCRISGNNPYPLASFVIIIRNKYNLSLDMI